MLTIGKIKTGGDFMRKIWNWLDRPITWKHIIISTILSLVFSIPYAAWLMRDMIKWPKIRNPFGVKFIDPEDGVPVIPAEE